MSEEGKEVLLNLLQTKSGHKQVVWDNTKIWFKVLKTEIEECIGALKDQLDNERIRLKFQDVSDQEARLYLGSDVIVFHMHSNVFKLAPNDFANQTSYVQSNPMNAYCGIINVYDFLADSYEHSRAHDLGYLICRIFINADNHFKVQGKGELGFLYKNFMHQEITDRILNEIILRIGIYSLDFDLLTPPYQAVQQVSVGQMLELSSNMKLQTGKRLGFKFQSDLDIEG